MSVTVDLFEQHRADRARRFAGFDPARATRRPEWAGHLETLREQGFVAIQRAFDPALMRRVKDRFDALAATGEGLQLPRDLRGVGPDDDYAKIPRLSADDLKKGPAYLRTVTSMLQADQPLLLYPELLGVGLDPRILDVAAEYLGCLPSLGFVKMRKSLIAPFTPVDTEWFHVDGNSSRMVKALVFIDDADEVAAAHEFVRGTHAKDGMGLDPYARFTEDDVKRRFGRDSIYRHFAHAGDIVIEDTTGLHRAVKPITRERYLVIFNYVVHEEYGGGGPKVRVRRRDVQALDPMQRAAADLLEWID